MKKILRLFVAVSVLSLAAVKAGAGYDDQIVWTDYGSVSALITYPYQYQGDYDMVVTISNGSTAFVAVELSYTHFWYTILENSGNFNVDVTNAGDWGSVNVDGLPPGYYTVEVSTPTYQDPWLEAYGW